MVTELILSSGGGFSSFAPELAFFFSQPGVAPFPCHVNGIVVFAEELSAVLAFL
jgi:hypothetical protein